MRRFLVQPLAALWLLLALAPAAKAQTTYTWNDSTTDWLTASGWTTSGPDWTSTSQLTDAIAAFASESTISNQPTIGSSTIYASKITFDNAGSAWSVSGSGTINVGSGGIVFAPASTSRSSTIAPTIALNSNQTWDIGSNNNVTASGVVSGSYALTKAGDGTLTLSGTNTYSGGTTLNAGTLRVASDANLGAVPSSAATNITFDGGTLQSEFASNLTLNANRSITLNVGGGTVNTGVSPFTSSNITIAGIVSGSGGLAITGFGTAVLSGINTYNGGTTISGFNTLRISSDANLGTVPSTPTTNLTFDRGALQLGSAFNLGSNRSIVLNSGGGEIDTNGYDSTYGGVISGSGALQKRGTGTLTLTGTSTYSGGTTIYVGGTLEVSSLADGGVASSLGASASNAANLQVFNGTLRYTGAGGSTDRLFALGYGLGGGTIEASGSGAISFTNAGTMGFVNNGTRTLTLSGTNTGANTLAAVIGDNVGATSLIKSGAGMWVLSGNSTYTGTTTINAGTLSVSSESNLGATPAAAAENVIFGGGTLQFGASFNPSSNRSITLNSGGGTIDTNGFDSTYGGVISGTGALTKAGNGTLTLSGTNTYSGGTTVSAGVLSIASTASLPGYSAGGDYDVTAGSTLAVGNGVSDSDLASMLGTGNFAAGSAVGFDTTAGDRSYAVVIADTSSGTRALGVTKLGSGTLTLTGSNTYTGDTSVLAGTLQAGSGSAFGNASSTIVVQGGTLDLNSLAITNPILNMGGTVINAGSYGGTTTASSGTTTVTGTVGGNVVVADGATLNATGATLTGSVTVNGSAATFDATGATLGGTVAVTGATFTAASATVNGPVTMTGGTLEGNGATFNAAVALDSGAIHNPGGSPGLQTFTNSLAYDATSVFTWELSANTAAVSDAGVLYDQVLVSSTGSLSITSGALANLVFNAALSDSTASLVDWSDPFWDTSHSWTMVDVDTANGATSTGVFGLGSVGPDANGVALSSVRSGAAFSLLSSGGSINVVYTVNAVPEPSMGVAVAGLASAAILLNLRRRSASRTSCGR